MISIITKTAVQLMLAATVGATGFGLAATHQNNFSTDASTQIDAPDASGAVQATADADTAAAKNTKSDLPERTAPDAAQVAADANATASATASGTFNSVPSAPSTPPTPDPQPSSAPTPPAKVNGLVHATGSVSSGSDVNSGGGGLQVGSVTQGSLGVDVSVGL